MDRRIDLDRARRDAKALLRAARGGDPDALGRQWMLAAQTEPADLGTRLEHAGCRPEPSAVFMSADLANRDLDDTRLPARIEIELLRDDAPLRHHEARQAGEPVGIVSAFTVQPTQLLTELAVEPHARRQGIGRALVLHALRDGSSRGCRLALLDPTPATVPFYEALGFALERFPPGRSFYLP